MVFHWVFCYILISTTLWWSEKALITFVGVCTLHRSTVAKRGNGNAFVLHYLGEDGEGVVECSVLRLE